MSIKGQSFSSAAADAAWLSVGVGDIATLFDGAFTIAVLCYNPTDNQGYFGGWESTVGGTDDGGMLLSGAKLYGMDDFSSGFGSDLSTSTWLWLVMSKDDGSAHYRMHWADLAGLTWTHGESSGAANHDDQGTSGIFSIGYYVYGMGYDNLQIAAAAVWKTHLSDGSIEAACTQLSSELMAANPDAAWLMPEAESATPGSIIDQTGGGADEGFRQYVSTSADPGDYTFDSFDFPIHFIDGGNGLTVGGTKFADGSPDGIITATQLSFSSNGTITHVRFPTMGTAAASTVQVGVYDNATQTLLASSSAVSDPGQDDDGGPFVNVALSSPLNVTGGTVYRVCVYSKRDGTANSQYWGDAGYFDGGNVTNNGITASQGWYSDGADALEFPTSSFGNNFYLVDVVFVPDAGGGSGTVSLDVSVNIDAVGGRPSRGSADFTVDVSMTGRGLNPMDPGVLFGNAIPVLDFADAAGNVCLALLVEAQVPGTITAVGRYGAITSPTFEAVGVFQYVDDATPGSQLAGSNDWQGLSGTIGDPAQWDYAVFSTGVHLDAGDRVYLTWVTDQFTSALGSESGHNPFIAGDVVGDGLTGLQDQTSRHNCRFNDGTDPAYPDNQSTPANFYPIDAWFVPDANGGEADFGVAVNLTAVGSSPRRGTADFGVAVALEGAGRRDSAGSVDVTVGVNVDAAGRRMSVGTAPLTVDVSMTAEGHRASLGAAGFDVAIALDASGVRPAGGVADFTLAISMTAVGIDPSTIPVIRDEAGLEVDYGTGLRTNYGTGLEADYRVGLRWPTS